MSEFLTDEAKTLLFAFCDALAKATLRGELTPNQGKAICNEAQKIFEASYPATMTEEPEEPQEVEVEIDITGLSDEDISALIAAEVVRFLDEEQAEDHTVPTAGPVSEDHPVQPGQTDRT